MAGSAVLLPEKLAPLVRNTIFSGNIHCYPEVESTNTLAMEAGAQAGAQPENAPEGAVFLAEEQTAGRGRGAHHWFSERGTGIYISFLLHPPMTPQEVLWLSLICGVALQDAAKEVTGLQADIRWPN
ncbi:MAG TPA: biotin--[acetyl-CoA-carboxylase] ligase, partial [Candidatus Limnocylindrales bacterium]|nr:biotin--[acetyl-CoA-carboxylase] ligase [Candidatus Limnocylindrales bacterium]